MKGKVLIWPGSRNGGCGQNSKRVSHYGCANAKGQQRRCTTGESKVLMCLEGALAKSEGFNLARGHGPNSKSDIRRLPGGSAHGEGIQRPL